MDPSLFQDENAANLKKPGYVVIKGQPCKIVEITLKKKATARGNDRLFVCGTHVFTGKISFSII